MRVPLPPESSHLEFIGCSRLGLEHTPRNVGPLKFGGAEAGLARLQGFHVVGSRETARPEEGQKAVQPGGPHVIRLFSGRQVPGRNLHVVGGHRFVIPDGDGHDVVDHQVGVDQQVSRRVGHQGRRALLRISPPTADALRL